MRQKRPKKGKFSAPEIMWTTPLYEFLRQCNTTRLKKTILDCGAGSHAGIPPPLFLFYQYGYKTYGIEIEKKALAHANRFCKKNHIPLNIIRGDMRRIPFKNKLFSFVYSFNAIVFMTKADIAVVMSEIQRVLKPHGLCFVNFLSVDDPDRGPFRRTSFACRLLKSKRFSLHKDNEADKYFRNFEILRKEKRLIEKLWYGRKIKQVYIDYIAKKK
ncbi:MAG: class I SAM-dependent methyltransferase [candidate division WOR-3 bacterium]|nr:MAG: class I SAM-dependent methyltransferase [candidate division WOR-3 bacterium]